MPIEFIRQYFEAERQQMFAVVAGSLVLAVAAGGLCAMTRDSFSKSFFVTVLVVAVTASGAALALLHRDASAPARLAASLQVARPRGVLDAEVARVAVVVSKYDAYRYFVVALGLVALAALTFTTRPWAHGIALGLLLLVVFQVVVDHYSELRARDYLARLLELRRAEGPVP